MTRGLFSKSAFIDLGLQPQVIKMRFLSEKERERYAGDQNWLYAFNFAQKERYAADLPNRRKFAICV